MAVLSARSSRGWVGIHLASSERHQSMDYLNWRARSWSEHNKRRMSMMKGRRECIREAKRSRQNAQTSRVKWRRRGERTRAQWGLKSWAAVLCVLYQTRDKSPLARATVRDVSRRDATYGVYGRTLLYGGRRRTWTAKGNCASFIVSHIPPLCQHPFVDYPSTRLPASGRSPSVPSMHSPNITLSWHSLLFTPNRL